MKRYDQGPAKDRPTGHETKGDVPSGDSCPPERTPHAMRDTGLLLVAPHYTTRPSSALSRHVRQQAHVANERIAVLCAVESDEDREGAVRTFSRDGVTVHSINRAFDQDAPLHGRYESPRALAAADRVLAKTRPTLIHVYDLDGIGVGLLDAARHRGIPVVVTARDSWLVCPRRDRIAVDGTPCHDIDRARCLGCLRSTDAALFPGGAHRLRDVADREAIASWDDRVRAVIASVDHWIVTDDAARDAWVRYGIAADRITVIAGAAGPAQPATLAAIDATIGERQRRAARVVAPQGSDGFGERFRRDVARVGAMAHDDLLARAGEGLVSLAERLRVDARRLKGICELGAHGARVGDAYRAAERELEWLRNERAAMTASRTELQTRNRYLEDTVAQLNACHDSLQQDREALKGRVAAMESTVRTNAEHTERTEQHARHLESERHELARHAESLELHTRALERELAQREAALERLRRSPIVRFVAWCKRVRWLGTFRRPGASEHARPSTPRGAPTSTAESTAEFTEDAAKRERCA